MHPIHATPTWVVTPPPRGQHCWTWTPAGLADLAAVRRELRTQLSGHHHNLPPLDGDLVDDVVTALDELTSNALRHGRAPVHTEVTASGDGYVVLVTDQAPECPLDPTSDRDPAQGGMGLGIIARTALSCGWFIECASKTVWALMPAGRVSYC